jgi:thiol:disulfide interchange protein DsbD
MRKIIAISIGLLPVFLRAQEPVSWVNSVKKINGNAYKIHLKATISFPWHLYSKNTPAEGPLPATIWFSKNPVADLTGTIKENGKLIKNREDVFWADVMYYDGEVDFVQTVTVKRNINTIIRGTLKYMSCNDSQCLHPKNISFQVPLQ